MAFRETRQASDLGDEVSANGSIAVAGKQLSPVDQWHMHIPVSGRWDEQLSLR